MELRMDDKRVRAIDEIVFEQTDPPTVLTRGSLDSVEAVLEGGVILYTGDERFMIDLGTFEEGFEAAL